jgi:hypothetical protein
VMGLIGEQPFVLGTFEFTSIDIIAIQSM